MIFARLEQNLPDYMESEPFLFCSQCMAYFFCKPGNFCPQCGHKFKDVDFPKIIKVHRKESMKHEEAIKFVRSKVSW